MKAYGGVKLELHLFLILPLDRCEWSAVHLCHLLVGKPLVPIEQDSGQSAELV